MVETPVCVIEVETSGILAIAKYDFHRFKNTFNSKYNFVVYAKANQKI